MERWKLKTEGVRLRPSRGHAGALRGGLREAPGRPAEDHRAGGADPGRQPRRCAPAVCDALRSLLSQCVVLILLCLMIPQRSWRFCGT